MRTTALQDRIVAVILLVLVAGGFAVTFDFSAIALYPRLLLGAMALMAAAIGLRSFLPARPREAGLPGQFAPGTGGRGCRTMPKAPTNCR